MYIEIQLIILLIIATIMVAVGIVAINEMGGIIIMFGLLLWLVAGGTIYYNNLADNSLTELKHELKPTMDNKSISDETKFTQIQLGCNKISNDYIVSRCIEKLTVEFLGNNKLGK